MAGAPVLARPNEKSDARPRRRPHPRRNFLFNRNYLDTKADRPITIVADYQLLIRNSQANILKSEIIEKHIFPQVISQFRSILSIQGPQEISGVSADICGDQYQLPVKDPLAKVQGDLIVFVQGQEKPDENYLAFAFACAVQQQYDKRPNVGIVVINYSFLPTTLDSLGSSYRVILHEMTHVLGFSSDLFSYFPNFNTTFFVFRDSVDSTTSVQGPYLKAHAQKHFGCDSAGQIKLENNGGQGTAGSHWEKLQLGPEIMTGMVNKEMPLSGFTLALLADSGWYRVNTDLQEQLFWGRGRGCSFLQAVCDSQFSEFSKTQNSGLRQCSDNFSRITTYVPNPLAENCFMQQPLDSGFCSQADGLFALDSTLETKGARSRCFKVTWAGAVNAGCFQSTCVSNSRIELMAGGKTLACETEGQQINLDA